MTEDDWRKVRGVIEHQLDAFAHDDAETAFSFASPKIQKLFQTPASFMAMVKADYQAVYRPRSVNFLKPAVVEGRALQPVQLLGPDSVAMVAIYTMEEQTDGTWKIDGCELTPSAGVFALLPVVNG
ncbi:MAG: DUF4864 domain-containing protein [Burkholderiales bacterium]